MNVLLQPWTRLFLQIGAARPRHDPWQRCRNRIILFPLAKFRTFKFIETQQLFKFFETFTF